MRASSIQDMIQVCDIADSQAENFDLGELLVRRQSGQQFAELSERHVEGFDTNALASRVSQPVLLCSTAAATTFFTREVSQRGGCDFFLYAVSCLSKLSADFCGNRLFLAHNRLTCGRWQ